MEPIDKHMKYKKSHELIAKIIVKEPSFQAMNLEKRIKDIELIEYPELYNFSQNDKKIDEILVLLLKLMAENIISYNDASKYLVSLLSEKTHYGFLCELMALSYMVRNNVKIRVEVEQENSKLLSSNSVALDGYIEEIDTFFDIKGFGVQSYAKIGFARLIEKEFPGSSVLISGDYDVSYDDINTFAFKDKNRVIDELRATGKSKIDDIYWSLRLSNERIRTSEGEFNPYREAENNKLFIFRKCSQFTVNSPFVLICAFDNQFNQNLTVNFGSHTDTMTRSIARRAFIEFKCSNEQAINVDKKCKPNVTLSDASLALSGILFLDMYNDKSWFYLNPNAKNKLDESALERAFDFKLPVKMAIDTFEYDNY